MVVDLVPYASRSIQRAWRILAWSAFAETHATSLSELGDVEVTISSDRSHLRIAFRNFYPGFRPNHFLLPLVELATGVSAVESNPARSDIVFTSVYEDYIDIWKRRIFTRQTSPGVPKPLRNIRNNAKQIWISGENIRAPHAGYDLTISFDTDSYGGSNIYWPYIFENLDWGLRPAADEAGKINSRGVPLLSPESVARRRDSNVSSRPGFVCAFIGNPEPIRLRAIDALRKYGEIDVFGSAFGRPVISKSEIAKDYRFVLSFENDVYPGYVTEKVLETYACGAVPLWRGLDSAGVLNPEALVNALDFSDLDAFAGHVGLLDSQPGILNGMSSLPLLKEAPSLVPLVSAMQNVLLR